MLASAHPLLSAKCKIACDVVLRVNITSPLDTPLHEGPGQAWKRPDAFTA